MNHPIDQALAEKEPGVTFVGRLASYKYFNMDQVLKTKWQIFDSKGDLVSLQRLWSLETLPLMLLEIILIHVSL